MIRMELKQVIVVRKDLKLSKGKMAAQAAHASLESFLKTRKKHPLKARQWLKAGAKKVVVFAKDKKELLEIKKTAEENNLPNALIIDAGLTQLKPGTITCLGIGPFDEEKIDKVTGELKLVN